MRLGVDNVRVMNFEGALRGMRNPLESWEDSDSEYTIVAELDTTQCFNWDRPLRKMGPKDHELAMKLALSGEDHGKFLRMITVCMDVHAPMSFFWDFDTYKIGTVCNSTSRMHKLGARDLTPDDFSWEMNTYRLSVIKHLNELIHMWKELKRCKRVSEADEVWHNLVDELPDSYMFTRTVTTNYEVLRKMYSRRKNHKLGEWRNFCRWIETLPYSELITTPRLPQSVY